MMTHSSVDSSALTILPPRVRVPSTPSTLFIVKFVLYLSLCWENDENNQKEAGFGPFKKLWWHSIHFIKYAHYLWLVASRFSFVNKSVFPANFFFCFSTTFKNLRKLFTKFRPKQFLIFRPSRIERGSSPISLSLLF